MNSSNFQHAKDKPWIFRTYAGHSTAKKSNELYRANLAAGQTGLSVAFDLPTQTALDSDHVLSNGEVGKVGVPIDVYKRQALYLCNFGNCLGDCCIIYSWKNI